jgi:hypothetical protein
MQRSFGSPELRFAFGVSLPMAEKVGNPCIFDASCTEYAPELIRTSPVFAAVRSADR